MCDHISIDFPMQKVSNVAPTAKHLLELRVCPRIYSSKNGKTIDLFMQQFSSGLKVDSVHRVGTKFS